MKRIVLAVALMAACGGGDGEGDEPSVVRQQADGAMSLLRAMYVEGLGTFGFRWWNSANALEATIDYTALTGSDAYVDVVANSFDVNADEQFLNDYYDDEGWWALTWIKAYDLTGEDRYLAMAEVIFADIAESWDDVCGGGVWWSREKAYKNAITNELFLAIAARLFARRGQAEYQEWAEREWAWFEASGMINADDLVNDGLDAECANNGQTTWTYNQGVLLGGLVALGQVLDDASHIERAAAIADAAVVALVDADGVLTEPCEPDCGGDGPQFKGIFMRNLSALRVALAGDDRYDAFIALQARSIREEATTEADEIGLMWAGPFDEAEPARQSSGLDAINAALALELEAE